MKNKYDFKYTVLERLENGKFREVVRATPEISYPRDRAYVAKSLARLRGLRHCEGALGKHQWRMDKAENGFAVYVDERRIGVAQCAREGASMAKRMIGRIVADGDYLLSEKQFGFEPPMILG